MPIRPMHPKLWEKLRLERLDFEEAMRLTEEGPEWPFQQEWRHFNSATNTPNQIRSLARTGHNLGVAVAQYRRGNSEKGRKGGWSYLSAAALTELRNLAGTGTLVFADSGAFSEVEFGPNGPVDVAPISHLDWLLRLSAMLQLAQVLGPQLYVVAPDHVGNQEDTLARLQRYLPQVQQLRYYGANVLVAMQKGRLSQADFDRRVRRLLGDDYYVRAMPMAKAATSIDELQRFTEYLHRVAPRGQIHLLGIGPKARNAAWSEAMNVMRQSMPQGSFTSDSNPWMAITGSTAKPRILLQEKARIAQQQPDMSPGHREAEAVTRVFWGKGQEELEKAQAGGWFDPESMDSALRDAAESYARRTVTVAYPAAALKWLLSGRISDHLDLNLRVAYRWWLGHLVRGGARPEDAQFASMTNPPLLPLFEQEEYRWSEGGFDIEVLPVSKGSASVSIRGHGEVAGGELHVQGGAITAALKLATGPRALDVWCKMMCGYGLKAWAVSGEAKQGQTGALLRERVVGGKLRLKTPETAAVLAFACECA